MSMSKGGSVPQLGWSWCVWQRAMTNTAAPVERPSALLGLAIDVSALTN
jgi:hypothetical protein